MLQGRWPAAQPEAFGQHVLFAFLFGRAKRKNKKVDTDKEQCDTVSTHQLQKVPKQTKDCIRQKVKKETREQKTPYTETKIPYTGITFPIKEP